LRKSYFQSKIRKKCLFLPAEAKPVKRHCSVQGLDIVAVRGAMNACHLTWHSNV
jgi:hypothetical protein